MSSIMSHCNLAGSGADQTARSSFHSILLGRAIGFLTRLGQASVRFGMHVRAKLVSCKEYLLDLLKVCKNSAMARMSRKSACSTSSGVSTSATVELVNLTIGKATHPTNVLVSTCGSAATSKLASVGVAGLIKVNAFNLGNVENTVSANLRPITSANVEPTAITNVNGISRPSKQAFALVAVVTAVLVATGAVMQASPSVKAKVSTSTKAKFKTKAKTSAKVKVKTEPDSPGIAKNTSQAHLESTVMANVESLEVANVESLEVANVESPEVANVESLEVANVEAVAEPNVLLNVEPNVSEPVTLADVEATGPAIAKSAELPSVDLTELTDEGVLSPSHVELTHSAAADAASLDHIAATDSVGGVAVETASPINTASDDSVDTNITDLADEGVAGSAHVELITSVNVEPASASNVEMVTPLKAETILASKNATKKAIKKTFDLVNVVSAVLAATGASVAKAKPPSSLAKIKKKIKSSTSTKTKAKTKSKTKSKTKAKTSAKVKDKTVSDSPGIAKNTSQAHLESTVMANVESPEVANVESPEVANVESLEVANVEAVAEPNVLLNVDPNVSEPVTLADVEAAGPAIAKSAELPSVDLTELTDEGVLSPSHVELTHSAAADAASLDHIAATDSVGGVAVETASPINTASDDSVDTDITDLADEGVAGSAHVELITSVNVEPASASNVEMVTPLKAETILASKNATKKAIKKTFDLVNVVSAVLAATGASVAKAKPPSSLAKIKKKIKSSTSTKTKAKTKSKTKSKTKAKTSAKVKDKTVSDSPGIAKNTSQAHLESTVMANVESLEVAGVETLKSTAMNESNMIVTEDHVATTTKLLDFADMENCSSRQMDQVEECIAIQQAGCGINDPEDFENASCNANMSLRDTADKKDLHSSAMDCVYLADHVSKTTQHLNPKRLLMGQLAEIAEMIARDPFVSNNGVIDAKKNGGIFTDYEDDTVGASKHNKSPSPLQDPMASQDLRNIVCEIESKEINEDEVELQSTKLCDWSSVDVDHSSNVQLKSFHKKAEDVLDVYKSQQSGAKVNVFKNRPSREEVATNSGVGHLVVASMKHVCTESFDGEMSNSASSVSSTTSSMIDNASQTEDSSTTGAIDLSADAVFGTEEAYEQTSVSTTKEDFVDVNAADQNVLEQSKVDSVESTLLEKFTLEPSSNQTPKTKSAYEDEEFARTYPCMNAFINEGPIGDWASCDDDVMWGQEAHGMHVEDARSAKQSITSPSSEAKKGYNISYFMPARGKKSSKKSSRKSSKKSSKKSSRTKVITTPQVQWEQRRTQSEANEDADTASSVETRASPISWDNLSRDTDENRNSLTNACAGSSDSTSWRRAKHTNSDIADQLKVESSMEGNKKSTFVYYPGTKAGSRRKVKK